MNAYSTSLEFSVVCLQQRMKIGKNVKVLRKSSFQIAGSMRKDTVGTMLMHSPWLLHLIAMKPPQMNFYKLHECFGKVFDILLEALWMQMQMQMKTECKWNTYYLFLRMSAKRNCMLIAWLLMNDAKPVWRKFLVVYMTNSFIVIPIWPGFSN